MTTNIDKKTIADKGTIVASWFKNNSVKALHSFSSSITIIMVMIPILISIIFRDIKGALITVGCIANIIFNIILKFTIKQEAIYGEGNKKICSFLEDYEIPENADAPASDFRMPSEHTQTIGYIFGFFIGRMIHKKSFNFFDFVIFLSLTIIIAWSRYNQKCHTLPQVSVGAILGICFGVAYYMVIKKCYDECDKEEETEQLCLASDDNEYKCEAIKDGYVINTDINS